MTSTQRLRRPTSSLLATAMIGSFALGSSALGAIPQAAADPVAPSEPDVTVTTTDPLLDSPQRGGRAIRALGDDLPTAAARNDLRPGALRSLLRTDNAAWIDPHGSVFYVDPAPEVTPPSGPTPAAAAPLGDTFKLHSNPDADLLLLLDFDGADVSGTGWNSGDKSVPPGHHPAWDPAGDGASFSDDERARIQKVWAIVAEDFAPFDVDVTTEDPGEAGMVRSTSSDTSYGARVLVTPSGAAHAAICNSGCGGVAYVGVFDRVGSYVQPAWVFPQALGNNAKSIAEAASHEAGHNLGLSHDGTAATGYYGGHGVWAPIMGVGYYKPLAQWSAGAYTGADTQEDDFSIIDGYLGLRPDEAPGSIASAVALGSGEALIGTRDDVDAWSLGSCTSGSAIAVTPAALAPNLDVRVTLHDGSGALVASSAPASSVGDGTTAAGLGASVVVPRAGDGWVITVDGVGEGSWAADGYDDYGSLGAYTVSAPGCGAPPVDGLPGTPTTVSATASDPGELTLSWSPPTQGDGSITEYVATRSGATGSVSLPAHARSHTFDGLAAGTSYQLSVRAVSAAGPGPVATVTATTLEPATPTPPQVTGTTPASTIPVVVAPSRMKKPRVALRGRKVVVRWKPAVTNGSPVSHYLLDLSRSRDRIYATSARKAVLRRLRPGRYKVRMTAVSSAGAARYTRWVRFRVR